MRSASILIALACMSSHVASPLFAAGNDPSTNIVLMYVDNLGYGDLGCYGNVGIKTPRIDQMAAEGVRCTDFYVASSTCSVSRGTLLTGRHAQRNGLVKQLGPEENWRGVGLPHRERIIPEYLKSAGYSTACFGKWNIGFAPGSRPIERGFDEFLGCRSGNIHYFNHTYHKEYDIFKGNERFHVEGYSTDIFADATCDYLRRVARASSPFFVYLPFNAPHYVSEVNMVGDEQPQWQVPEKYLNLYGWKSEDADERHRYFAVIAALDAAVGRVLDTLEELGLRENTLVIFVSDMGAILRPKHGFNSASNYPFRDGAPSMYEGSIRVPAIFRWPEKISAGLRCNAVLCNLDLLPLCLLAAGLERPSDRVLDGQNPLPALNGTSESPHDYVVSQLADAVALRQGPWKIVRPHAASAWELYDINANPVESLNLARKNPQQLSRLVELFAAWEKQVHKDASPPVPFEP